MYLCCYGNGNDISQESDKNTVFIFVVPIPKKWENDMFFLIFTHLFGTSNRFYEGLPALMKSF